MTRQGRLLAAVALCFVLWTVTASLLLAQVASSTITGLVTDNAGAVIPGAKITVTNDDTLVSQHFVTDDAGQYVSPYMQPGRYTVAVEHTGFTVYKQSGIVLTAGQKVEVNAQLQVGSTTTVVQVQAQALALQTETSSVQGTVTNSLIESIPIVNHNPFYAVALLPGVVAHDEQLSSKSVTSFGVGMYARDALSAFAVNGGQALESDITVDGISVMGPQMNEALILPNKDGIEEVRAITNDFSAEYGRGNGAIAVITKSGTNRFRGSLFDNVRNEALNANTFQNNVLGLPKIPFKVNYFGGTIGGPIKKDKLFFFAGFEGLTHHTNETWLATVPTALERNGNFGATLVNNSGVATPLQLFDPFNATLVSPNLYQHAQIPNAIITNPNQAAVSLYNQYPLPNRTPIDVYNDQNFYSQGLQTTRREDVNGRIDFHHGIQTIYGSGGIHDGLIHTPQPWGPNNINWIPGSSAQAPIVSDRNPYVGIGDTIIISPTMVVDVRIGVQRINTRFVSQLYPGYNYNAVGIPASVQAVFVLPGAVPNVNQSGQRWSALNYTNTFHKYVYMTNWTTAGSVTEVWKKWTFKQGVEYRDSVFADPNIYEGSASFASSQNFSEEYSDAFGNRTAQDTIAPLQGFYEAGLLLGAGDFVITPGQSVQPLYDDKYFALYSQNDWRATARLTINLGLRWDVQPAATERYNRISSIDTAATNTWGTAGVIAFPGVGTYGRNLWGIDYGDVGPRLGAAYKISDSLVARGGWGIIYTPSNSGLLHGPLNFGSAPFTTYLNDVPYGTNPAGVPIGTFSDPAISIPTSRAGADPTAPQNYANASTGFPKYGYQDERVQQWNFFVEKSFKGGWIVSGGYVGTKGTHAPVSRIPLGGTFTMGQTYWTCYRSGVNCPAADSDLTGKGYINTGHDPANDSVTNPWNPNGTIPFGAALASATIPRYVRDSRYPMLYNDTSDITYGFSNHRALQLNVRHSFTSGLTLNANYTWSRTMDFGGAQAPLSEASSGIPGGGPAAYAPDLRYYLNPEKNIHLSYYDIPQRVAISGVYELPFGPGKHFRADNHVANVLISGWKLGWVAILQAGFPTPIGGGDTGSMNYLPNQVPGEPLQVPKSLQHWYNGTTTVALPDGRLITPCAHCFLKYNVDAFSAPVVPNPASPGTYLPDNYWLGNAAITYSSITGPHFMNLDLNIARTFKVNERVSVEFAAMATNALNHNEPGNQIASGFAYNATALGGVNVVPPSAANNNTQLGQPAGSSTYGTYGLGTYDPRQVELDLKIRF